MQSIGKFGKVFWSVALGFIAGAIFVIVLLWFRESSAPSRSAPLPHTSRRERVEVPAMPKLSTPENPASLPEESASGLAQLDQTFESFGTITERNIFSKHRTAVVANSGFLPPGPGGDVGSAQAQAKANQPLPFRLLGTVASDGRDSYAILEITETKAQDIYRVGQTIGDVRIDFIEQNRVVVLRNGSRETLELVLTGQSVAAPSTVAIAPISTPQRAPGDFVRVAIDGVRQLNTAAPSTQASRAVDSFLQRLRLSPEIVDGESVGLRVSGLEDSMMAQLIGLRDGDVIQSVNRHPVTNRRKAVQVLSKARRSGSAELSLMRGQKSTSLVLQTNVW